MTTVEQVLAYKGRKVWTIDPDALVIDAIAQMAARDIGALVVVEGARVVGLISEREYARNVALAGRSSRDTRVRDIMLEDLPRVAPGTEINACMALMTAHRVRHLPVMAGAELVGLISIGDLVAAVIDHQRETIARLERDMAGR
jgi:CBS domain-containing protein